MRPTYIIILPLQHAFLTAMSVTEVTLRVLMFIGKFPHFRISNELTFRNV